MESRQGLVASGSQISQDIWQDDGTRMSDSCVTSRRCDLHSYQFGWLRGIRNSLGQNSSWLRRLDLNQRTSAEPVLTRHVDHILIYVQHAITGVAGASRLVDRLRRFLKTTRLLPSVIFEFQQRFGNARSYCFELFFGQVLRSIRRFCHDFRSRFVFLNALCSFFREHLKVFAGEFNV